MSLFHSIIAEVREFSLQKWEAHLDGAMSSMSGAGIPVNADTAMTWAIVWGCILVKSQDIAKIPLVLYKRMADGGREEAVNHPAWRMFRWAPNPYMTPFVFKQSMQVCRETHGAAYAVIERDEMGTPVALWPRNPENIRPKIVEGRLVYETTINGLPYRYEANEIFHLRGMSRNGFESLSPIEYFREGIGLGIGYQSHAANTFRNQARPSLVASTPNVNLSPEKAKEIARAITEQNAGASNAGKVIVAYGGMELKPWGFSNRDSEYINSARLSNEDACRIWRMPPYKVMDYTQSAYANMATASEEYVNDTLRPDQVVWEEEIFAKLLTERERSKLYAEFNNDALLKGTPKERAEVEEIRLRSGVLQIDEVRASINKHSVPGGNKNRVQMQYQPIDAPPLPVPDQGV